MDLRTRGGSEAPRRSLFWLAAVILVFNLVDALLTLGVTHLGLADEANPVMALSLSRGPLAFMAVKLSMVSIGVAILWRYRHRRSAALGFAAGAVVYSMLMLYHVKSVGAVATYLAASGTMY